MYRFALRPLWILSHLFAVAVVVAFVALGFWQLDRHDQRADRNATVEARADLPAVPVADALAEVDDPDDLRFRAVTAGGTSPATIASVKASAARSASLNASEVRHISSSATS